LDPDASGFGCVGFFCLLAGGVWKRKCIVLIGIVGWIVLGLVVGFIAAQVVNLRGDDPRLGVIAGGVGGIIGGFLFSHFTHTDVTSFNLRSLFYATVGAAAALAIWHGWRLIQPAE
jgi:uncharacterized membrane protein YeaQ/YmgE (transglycosylase-associated protein family)